MKSRFGQAFIIFFFVALLFLFFTVNRASNSVTAPPLPALVNKEASKALIQEPAPPVKSDSPLAESERDHKAETLLAYDKADACSLMRMDGQKLSTLKSIETIFNSSNKFRDDQSSAGTSEYVIKNILYSGPVDPDAPVDTNDVIEFYRALVYGGLITPQDYPKFINHKKAEEILTSLETKYPENGAFSIFKAGVLHLAGAPDEQLKPLYVKGMMAAGFNTFHSDIWVPVLQRSFTTPEVYVLAERVMGHARIIDYTTAFRPLFRLLETKDPEYAKLALEFAAKLYPKNIPEKGRFEFYEWFAMDFAMSEKLRFKAQQYLDRKKKIAPAKKLSEILTWYDDPDYNSIKKNKDGTFACDREIVQFLISKEENIYSNFLKSKNEIATPSN